MADKAKTYNTPVLVFGPYPKITAADFKFKPEGEFSLKGILPTDHPIALKMIKLADRIADEALAGAVKNDKRKPADQKKTPWALNEQKAYSAETDDEGNETGKTIFKFSMKHSGISKKTNKPWKMWPKLFDANGKAIPRVKDEDYTLRVWGGSEGVVSFEAVPYAVTANVGAGCKFSLAAVQIAKLVEGGDGGDAESYGFGKIDGGFSADEMPEGADMGGDAAPSEASNGSAEENDDF